MNRILRVLAIVFVSTIVTGFDARAVQGAKVLPQASQSEPALCFDGTAVSSTSRAQEEGEEGFDMCDPGQVYRAIYYYEYPGGPECGLKYQYCDGTPPYYEGCRTAYYDQYFFCECQ